MFFLSEKKKHFSVGMIRLKEILNKNIYNWLVKKG